MLCLDTGRNSKNFDQLDKEKGRRARLTSDQIAWVRTVLLRFPSHKLAIVFHHPLFSGCWSVGGRSKNIAESYSQLNPHLYDDIVSALHPRDIDQVDYFYWADEHWMLIYNDRTKDYFRGIRRARCVGGGAMPTLYDVRQKSTHGFALSHPTSSCLENYDPGAVDIPAVKKSVARRSFAVLQFDDRGNIREEEFYAVLHPSEKQVGKRLVRAGYFPEARQTAFVFFLSAR